MEDNSQKIPSQGIPDFNINNSAASSGNPVFPVTGKRNMIMFTLNRNEITLLTILNQVFNFCIGSITFFIGVIFTLILTRISMPSEQYNITNLAIVFWWVMGFSIVVTIALIFIAFFTSKKKPEILGIIEKETDHT